MLCRRILQILIRRDRFILRLFDVLIAFLLTLITLRDPLHNLASHRSLILYHLYQLFALKLIAFTPIEPII